MPSSHQRYQNTIPSGSTSGKSGATRCPQCGTMVAPTHTNCPGCFGRVVHRTTTTQAPPPTQAEPRGPNGSSRPARLARDSRTRTAAHPHGKPSQRPTPRPTPPPEDEFDLNLEDGMEATAARLPAYEATPPGERTLVRAPAMEGDRGQRSEGTKRHVLRTGPIKAAGRKSRQSIPTPRPATEPSAEIALDDEDTGDHKPPDPSQVHVTLYPVPPAPPLDVEELLAEADQWISRPKLVARALQKLKGAPVFVEVQRALTTELDHQSRLQDFFDKIYRALTDAWIRAGAPRHLGGIEGVSPESGEEKAHNDRKLRALEEERLMLKIGTEKRTRALQRQIQALDNRIGESVQELELVEDALARCERDGSTVLDDLRDQLPERLCTWMRQAPQIGVRTALRQRRMHIRKTMERLRTRKTEADALVHRQRDAAQRKVVNLEAKIDRMRVERARRERTVSKHMVQIGHSLAPNARAFANGRLVLQALNDARQLQMESRGRSSRLEEVVAQLGERLSVADLEELGEAPDTVLSGA